MTSVLPDRSETRNTPRFFDRERINLESHQLMFLNTEPDQLLFTLNQLRQIVDHTRITDTIDETLQAIQQTTDTTTFLICFVHLGEILIPQIHTFENVRSIYIYCHSQPYDEQWLNEYPKIKNVYTDPELLVNALQVDVEQYLQNEKNGIFSEFGRDNYTSDIHTFSWWNYVIHLICHLTYPDNSRTSFVEILRNYYEGKAVELKILDEFSRDYSPNTAILWYTRNTFLYLLINKALRQKNIEVIFLCGFFIRDIYSQLQNQYEILKMKHRNDPIIKVYRGQIISLSEIHWIKSSQFINTSFFSTSLDHSYASFLLGSSSGPDDENQHIFFEIEIDVRLVSQPFGSISSLSYFPNENEVLLMIGNHFKTTNWFYDDHRNVYVANVKLEADPSVRPKRDFFGMSPRTILKVGVNDISQHLYRVGVESIQSLFSQLYQLFPNEKEWLNAMECYTLATLYSQFHIKHYPEYVDITLSQYRQALMIYELYLDDGELYCAIDIARVYLGMGSIYRAYVEDNALANEYYDLGIILSISLLPSIVNRDKRIELYNVIGWLYEVRTALETDQSRRRELIFNAIAHRKTQFEEMLTYSSYKHSDFIECIYSLAKLQASIDLISEAQMNYEKVIDLYLKEPVPNFGSSEGIYKQLSKIFIERNDYTTGLSYKQKELECKTKNIAQYSGSYKLDMGYFNRDVAETYEELSDICIQLQQYKSAHEHLKMAMQLYESADTWKSEENLAIITQKLKSIEEMYDE
ncbi:unnamed protein product [Adineta ricciae]|uniref:NAD(P)(+)--arginine ADP-ribosyltransferase n=1 Tax=Adineta ricciae TaxID=249248 RepID=A0A814QGP0_ADIRI|nr:unnamed protein product [Adineta ricciae]CAF1120099.1 unnamed protein product [Adineta ricciae]